MDYIELTETVEAFIADDDIKKKSYQKKYRCPYCNETFERNKLHIHIQNKHEDMIPEGHTALRVAFNQINHKTEGYCIICRNISPWNEDKGRYERLCKNPKCHQKYKKMVAERNKKVYGVERLQTDERYNEFVQKKALSGRKISGVYKFKDGGSHQYVGSYERNFLEFMDKVMNCSSEDLVEPGPGISYEFEGKKHLYLPDFFYIPYQLLIEIKDGGDNPNNHPHRAEDEKKNKAKESAVKKLNKYSYVRVVNNDFSQLLTAMAVLKYNMQDNDPTPVVITHESMVLESGLKSTLDKDHKQKGSKKLSDFKLEVKEAKYKKTDIDIFELEWKDEDGKPICWVCVDKNPASDGYRWFWDYEVSKKYRGYGLGKQVVEFIKNKYKAGALSVNTDNEIAIRLYKQCGFKELERKDPKKKYYYLYYPPNREKVQNEQTLSESLLFNGEDLCYNKDKFNSGEINLLFITGLSGSGKTTLSKMYEDIGCIVVHLDQLLCFCVGDFSEKSRANNDMIKSFYLGPGKIFIEKKDGWYINKYHHNQEKNYEIVKMFIDYAIQYAQKHPSQQFVIEGTYIAIYTNVLSPEYFQNYAIIIKNTPICKSILQASDRDEVEDYNDLADHYNDLTISRFTNFYNYYNSKSQDLVETNMTGTIQAALPNESNGIKYYLVQHLQNNVFSHALTKDPAQNTIYEVEPMEDDERYYKVSKTTKDKIDSDYKTFEIKNTELAKEIYNELAAIYQSENSVIYDTECNTSYLYNKLTEGGYLYDPEQLLIDPRFKLVDNPKSIQEECYELYSYLTNKNNIDLLEAQIQALYEQMRASSSLETVEHNKWIYSIATLQLELQKHHSTKAKERIRNTILELGWIPDIPITKESFRLFENYCSQIPLYEEIDLTNQISLSDIYLSEAGQSKREKVPVFIVLTHSIETHMKNIVGKAIQWYTNSKWDHAEIGFDSSLDLLYTFRTGGFFISGIDYWLEENKYAPLEIKVNVLWVTPAQREKMIQTIKYYMHNIRKTSYALYNIVNIFFKRALLPFDNKFERICSQFVYTLCNIGKFDLKKPSSFVRPADLDEHRKLYKVYEGPVEKYKKFKVDRILTDLQNKLFNK